MESLQRSTPAPSPPPGLCSKGALAMDDDVLLNHVLVIASHLYTIFDESIEEILPYPFKHIETAPRQITQILKRMNPDFEDLASPTYSTCSGSSCQHAKAG